MSNCEVVLLLLCGHFTNPVKSYWLLYNRQFKSFWKSFFVFYALSSIQFLFCISKIKKTQYEFNHTLFYPCLRNIENLKSNIFLKYYIFYLWSNTHVLWKVFAIKIRYFNCSRDFQKIGLYFTKSISYYNLRNHHEKS